MFGLKLLLFHIKGEKRLRRGEHSKGRDVPGITGCSVKGAEWLEGKLNKFKRHFFILQIMWTVHELDLFGYQYLSQMS